MAKLIYIGDWGPRIIPAIPSSTDKNRPASGLAASQLDVLTR